MSAILGICLVVPPWNSDPRAWAAAPGAPTDVAGSPGDGQVFLSWVAPVSTGGAAITGYRVQVSTSSGGGFADAAGGCAPASAGVSTTVRCDASGLTNGQGYYFRVAAINADGTGSYSTVSAAVTPAAATARVVTINGGGGTSASDGLKFAFGGGSYQVTRYNANTTPPASSGQLYSEGEEATAPLANSSLYNGTWLRVGSRVVGPCEPTTRVNITSAVGSGSAVTYTTATAHGLSVGSAVQIVGINPSGYNSPTGISGSVKGAVVESVPSTTTFTVASSATGAYVSGGLTTSGTISPASCPVAVASTPITAMSAWSSVVSSGGSSNSVAGGSGTALSTLTYVDPTSGLTYTLVLRFDYTAGDPYVTQTATLTVPAGNATACSGAPCEIKLYQAMDTFLGGSDQGAGFRTLDRSGDMLLIGVRSTSGTTEALRWRSGDRWTGYISGQYNCAFRASSCGGGNIPADGTGAIGAGGNMWTGTAAIDSRATTDNAIGVMWDVADTAGTTTYAADVLFAVAPVVSTASVPATATCATYSQTLAATSGSGTYTDWAVSSGTLPPGLTLNASTGVLSGTPTTVGTYTFDVTVTDSNYFTSEAKSYTLAVTQGMPVVSTASLAGGVVGSAYTQTLAAQCGTGTYTAWAITTGALPTGLTLNTATGVISGTPTTAQVSPITVRVTDSGSNTATKALSITVTTTTPAPAPSSSSSPSASSPSVPTCTLTNASAITNGVNGNVPAGGVPAGAGVMLVGCSSVPFTTTLEPTGNPTSITFQVGGFRMRLEGRGSSNDPLGLIGQAVLQLLSAPEGSGEIASRAQVSGSGAQPGSVVNLYLAPSGSYRSAGKDTGGRGLESSEGAARPRAAFTWPYFLGQVPVDPAGNFDGSVPIPPGLTPGDYTIQANAMGTDAKVRSLTIGAIVTRPAAKPIPSGRLTVRFNKLSAELTKGSKQRLRALANEIGPSIARAVVLGYVQDAGRPFNNKTLSAARATNVTKFLRKVGLRGSFISKGRGVDPSNRGPYGRRVDVTIIGRAQ